MNLVREEESSAQLFTADRVRAVLVFKAEKQAKIKAEKAQRVVKKVVAEENKQKKR